MTGENLTPNQRKALAALLTNPTTAAAARACGLSDRVITKYKTLPQFAAALAEGREAQLSEAVNSLAASYGAAVGTLRSIAENPKEQAQARVNAAKALLDYGLRFSEASNGGGTMRVVFVDDITGAQLPAPQNQEEAQPDADA